MITRKKHLTYSIFFFLFSVVLFSLQYYDTQMQIELQAEYGIDSGGIAIYFLWALLTLTLSIGNAYLYFREPSQHLSKHMEIVLIGLFWIHIIVIPINIMALIPMLGYAS